MLRSLVLVLVALVVGVVVVVARPLVNVGGAVIECSADAAGPTRLTCNDGGNYNHITVGCCELGDGGYTTAAAYINNGVTASAVHGWPLSNAAGGVGYGNTLGVPTRLGQLYCSATATGVHVRTFCGREVR